MTDPADNTDIVVRSVTVSVVLDGDGDNAITYETEGNPSDWDVLGLLAYADAAIRNRACFGGDEDDE